MMEQPQDAPVKVTLAEQLKAVLFQFVTLYERWSEDRQVLMAQVAKLDEAIQNLSGEIESLSDLEPDLQERLQGTIKNAGTHVAEIVKWEASALAKETMGQQANRLHRAIDDAELLLQRYALSSKWMDWKHFSSICLMALATAVGVGVFVAWLLMPAPTLPLTDDQFTALMNGKIYARVWPKLSAEDQAHWNAVKDKIYKTKPTQP